MRKLTFKAVTRQGSVIVTGWQLRCGAVVHRQLLPGRLGMRDDFWTVSNPVSGACFVHGFSMGDVVASYRRQRAKFGTRFAEQVAFARQDIARQMAAERAAGSFSVSANGTQVVMREGGAA